MLLKLNHKGTHMGIILYSIIALVGLLVILFSRKKTPNKQKEYSHENYQDWRDDPNSIYHDRKFM